MDRHQTGQEEKLVEVKVEMDHLEGVHQRRASPVSLHGCFKCMVALATVMGLVIVILVAGFVLHYLGYMPPSSQEAPSLRGAAKVISAHSLKRRGDEEGTYDLFTVDRGATYLIYGWVKLADDTGEDVVLMQTFKGDKRVIERKAAEKSEVFFFKRKLLANNSTVSVHFKSAYTDGLFHVYEL